MYLIRPSQLYAWKFHVRHLWFSNDDEEEEEGEKSPWVKGSHIVLPRSDCKPPARSQSSSFIIIYIYQMFICSIIIRTILYTHYIHCNGDILCLNWLWQDPGQTSWNIREKKLRVCDGRWAGLRLGNLEMGGHRCEKSILCDLQSRAIVGGDNGRTNNQCIVKCAFS